MRKFVMIFWPQAVGKMTVWQELSKITDLKLFHNHITIDLVNQFFDYGTPEGKRLVKLFRNEILESVAKSDLYGIIFTYIRAFDMPSDSEYVQYICNIFKENWWEVYLVELEADLDTRLDRNKTENRLNHKPSKRDIEKSDKNVIDYVSKFRMNSLPWEIKEKNYIKINNTNISASETAKIIKDRFVL